MIPFSKWLLTNNHAHPLAGNRFTNMEEIEKFSLDTLAAGIGLYVDPDTTFDEPDDGGFYTDTLFATMDQDDPLGSIDWIMRNAKADAMGIEKLGDVKYVRLWWD
jgi:hypothetical protein